MCVVTEGLRNQIRWIFTAFTYETEILDISKMFEMPSLGINIFFVYIMIATT